VMGRGSVIGDALVNHAGIHAISFTRSVGVGRTIAVQCAARHKKVQLEKACHARCRYRATQA